MEEFRSQKRTHKIRKEQGGFIPCQRPTGLQQAFPDMRSLSPRNLKYMRAFASAWPERRIVQEGLAQITWYHNIALFERLGDSQTRYPTFRQRCRHPTILHCYFHFM
jgi:hypothetical protein